MFEKFRHKKVLVTGHTGFKGCWLTSWLTKLGARVYGFSLPHSGEEILFQSLELGKAIEVDKRGDILDLQELAGYVAEIEPDVVFHLAAQPLVRKSYIEPVNTFSVNVMGTIHALEAIRPLKSPCTIVAVTTDKCYENREWLHAYREEDALGGHDPYSASKACAEIAVNAYRRSYFFGSSPIKLASARAGNVIGGGDWATDRIVPDIFRAIQKGEPVPIRNRSATRPWQHVLEPISGYLRLAEALVDFPDAEQATRAGFCEAYNFGPQVTSNCTVLELVENILKVTTGSWVDRSNPSEPHEASKLNLAIDKAYHRLGWKPVWDFAMTVAKTAEWYRDFQQGADPIAMTRHQIEEFEASLEKG